MLRLILSVVAGPASGTTETKQATSWYVLACRDRRKVTIPDATALGNAVK